MDQQLLNKIELELKKAVPEKATAAWVKRYLGPAKLAQADDLTAFDRALLAPMRELLGRGGKRWRPYLLVLCAQTSQSGVPPSSLARLGTSEGQSGPSWNNLTTAKVGSDLAGSAVALALAPVPELLHNATLIVDDFEDRSPERRGGLAIHKIYGEDIALNAANFFYFYPILYLRVLAKGGSVPLLALASMESSIVEEMANVHLGQALDIYWHNNPDHPVTEAMYFEMCRLKTGTMARLAARLGVLAAIAGSDLAVSRARTASPEASKASFSSVPAQPLASPAELGKFAETLGVAFQIRDDLENISPQGRPGKALGDDITEGKRSLLVIRALTQLRPAAAAELKQILKSHSQDRGPISRAIELINSTDAFIYTRQTIIKYKQKALKILAESELKDVSQLADLANQIA